MAHNLHLNCCSKKKNYIWTKIWLFNMQVDIPASALCVQSLVEASLGLSEHAWDVGWSLASHNNDSQPSKDNFQTQVIPLCSSLVCFILSLWTSSLYKFIRGERYPCLIKTLEAWYQILWEKCIYAFINVMVWLMCHFVLRLVSLNQVLKLRN